MERKIYTGKVGDFDVVLSVFANGTAEISTRDPAGDWSEAVPLDSVSLDTFEVPC